MTRSSRPKDAEQQRGGAGDSGMSLMFDRLLPRGSMTLEAAYDRRQDFPSVTRCRDGVFIGYGEIFAVDGTGRKIDVRPGWTSRT